MQIFEYCQAPSATKTLDIEHLERVPYQITDHLNDHAVPKPRHKGSISDWPFATATRIVLRPITTTLAYLIHLLPYLIPRRGRPVREKAPHQLHPLAYLDALRGYLALIIFTGHTMSRHWRWIPAPIIAVPWLQFPFRGGQASLNIFFWISGYAVSYKIVGLVQARTKKAELLDALTSAVFRRYWRLFLPILPVTLICALAVDSGLAIPPPEKMEVVKGNALIWWMKDSGHLLNPFSPVRGFWSRKLLVGSELLDVTWSLSTEFRSSMTVFLFLLATARMSSTARKRVIWAAMPALFAWQTQYIAMAWLGVWFSECRQERTRNAKAMASTKEMKMPDAKELKSAMEIHPRLDLPTHVLETAPSSLTALNPSRFRSIGLTIMFLYSFIVIRNPHDKDRLPPYNLLDKLLPDYYHPRSQMQLHLCIGTFFMLYPLDRLAFLQRPLLLPFSQYLGELSFGIYAVHYLVRWIVWEPRYVRFMEARYPPHAMDRFWIACPGWLAMMIIVLWAAELFRRMDWQVVRLCRVLEERAFI